MTRFLIDTYLDYCSYPTPQESPDTNRIPSITSKYTFDTDSLTNLYYL